MIAALFVEKGGCYDGLPHVDAWTIERDARLYAGPWPVVAHPPCARWGRYFFGGPTAVRKGYRLKLGDDQGCFAAALAAVRRFGGVLEHPEGSHAWRAFDLITPPRGGAWVSADFEGGWTCCVEQGHYGHRARKATWLYAAGVDLPSLLWGKSDKAAKIDLSCRTKEERARIIKTGICQQMSKLNRARTPLPFRDLLLSIAAEARGPLPSKATPPQVSVRAPKSSASNEGRGMG